MSIPPSFDYEFYNRENGGFGSREEAYEHFIRIGKQRGLQGSPGCNQGNFLKIISKMQPASVLEIGPGASPRLSGSNVYYFDVKTEEELRQRYKDEKTLKSIPEEIHFVQEDGDLSIIDRRFDIVFSSHAIEHTADLVKHLNQIEAVLHDNGYYFLVVPNKKYSFDYYKPTTTLEDVVATHIFPQGENFQFLRSYLMEQFRRTHNDAKLHWAGEHGAPRGVNEIGDVIKGYQSNASRPIARSGYHRWIFDEDSFVEVIDGLHKIGLSRFKVCECYNTIEGTLSFKAILVL